MKYRQITSWFLAVSMLMFGVLKFVDPFKGWYGIQIARSGLGGLSYAMGILGEIAVGAALVLSLSYKRKVPAKIVNLLTRISFFAIMAMMLTGVYVHLHPNVPASVLPLKIKPPYIPLFFFALALSNVLMPERHTTGQSGKVSGS